jgi:hypothetical protein
MVQRQAFLFGCRVSLDHPRVSANVMKMTLSFLNNLTTECGRDVRSHSMINGFFNNERQAVSGIFQMFWLGYFSSPELRKFTKMWFAYPNGHRIHRWGDQQYYFGAHALFAINASETIITDNEVAGCSYYRPFRSAPTPSRATSR